MSADKNLDAASRPMRIAVIQWAKERGFGSSQRWDGLQNEWLLEIHTPPPLHLQIEINEKGTRALVLWCDNVDEAPCGSAKTPAGIVRVLNWAETNYPVMRSCVFCRRESVSTCQRGECREIEEKISELEHRDELDDAVGDILRKIDALLVSSDFKDCNDILKKASVSNMTEDVMVAFLVGSLPASRQLPERSKFARRVRSELKKRGIAANEIDEILEGLI